MAAGAIGTLAAVSWLSRRRAAALLRKLPGLTMASYLETLSEEHSEAALEISLRFAADVSGKDQSLLASRVAARFPKAKTVWSSDQALRITSEPYSCVSVVQERYRRTQVSDNGPLHRFLAGVAQDCLFASPAIGGLSNVAVRVVKR